MDNHDQQHGRWVETDEAEDVAGSVRHVLRCWKETADDSQAFKWTSLVPVEGSA